MVSFVGFVAVAAFAIITAGQRLGDVFDICNCDSNLKCCPGAIGEFAVCVPIRRNCNELAHEPNGAGLNHVGGALDQKVQVKRAYTTITMSPTTTTIFVMAGSATGNAAAITSINSTVSTSVAKACTRKNALSSGTNNATATLSCATCLPCLHRLEKCREECLPCASLTNKLSSTSVATASVAGTVSQSTVTSVTIVPPSRSSTMHTPTSPGDSTTRESCATNGMMGFSSCTPSAGAGTSGGDRAEMPRGFKFTAVFLCAAVLLAEGIGLI